MNSYVVQIKSIWPGKIGGAIFKANVLGQSLQITCKASYKVIDRVPEVGEIWNVVGSFVNHGVYGSQLSVTRALISHLSCSIYVESILLRHPAFRGFHFGRTKVKKLMDELDTEELINVLDSADLAKLSAVLGEAIAKGLLRAWQYLSNEIGILNFLFEHKLDSNLCREILKIREFKSVSRLKENPYALICFYHSSEKKWRAIDATARKLQIDPSDARRLIGGLEYVMYQALADGHTAIIYEDLCSSLRAIFQSSDLAEGAISIALHRKFACAFSRECKTYLQLVGVAYIEYSIETKLTKLLKSPTYPLAEGLVARAITSYSREFAFEFGYPLSPGQERAVELSLTNRCSVLTGFGGTGKTTALRAIGEILNSLGRQVIYLAFSGKATERLSKATGRDAMTIYRFIGGVESGAIDTKSDPLVVIGECSMVDCTLFNRFLNVFGDAAYSLLAVGDVAQVPPVGFGLVWHKMVESPRFTAVHLTEVYRHVEGSPLHAEVMRIRSGLSSNLMPFADEKSGVFLIEANRDSMVERVIALKAICPDAQVITPFSNGDESDCARTLNKVLQEYLNPLVIDEFNMFVGKSLLRKDDPVIFTRNNYHLNLFNGTTGQIQEVYVNSEQKRVAKIKVAHSNEIHSLTEADLNDAGVELSYAISANKSQGSEYSEVIFCCVRQSPFVERSLVYTAMTCAKELCIIVGTQANYSSAVANEPRAKTLCVGLNI